MLKIVIHVSYQIHKVQTENGTDENDWRRSYIYKECF